MVRRRRYWRPDDQLSNEEVVKAVGLLTQREREVMDAVLAGDANKETGQKLGISHRTVESHRSSLLDTIGARNSIHLVRILTRAGY